LAWAARFGFGLGCAVWLWPGPRGLVLAWAARFVLGCAVWFRFGLRGFRAARVERRKSGSRGPSQARRSARPRPGRTARAGAAGQNRQNPVRASICAGFARVECRSSGSRGASQARRGLACAEARVWAWAARFGLGLGCAVWFGFGLRGLVSAWASRVWPISPCFLKNSVRLDFSRRGVLCRADSRWARGLAQARVAGRLAARLGFGPGCGVSGCAGRAPQVGFARRGRARPRPGSTRAWPVPRLGFRPGLRGLVLAWAARFGFGLGCAVWFWPGLRGLVSVWAAKFGFGLGCAVWFGFGLRGLVWVWAARFGLGLGCAVWFGFGLRGLAWVWAARFGCGLGFAGLGRLPTWAARVRRLESTCAEARARFASRLGFDLGCVGPGQISPYF